MPDQPWDPGELDPSLFMNDHDRGLIVDFKQLHAYNASIIDEFDDAQDSATLSLDPAVMLVEPDDTHVRLLRRTMLRDLHIPQDSVPLFGFDDAWTNYGEHRERIFQIQRADKVPIYARYVTLMMKFRLYTS